MVGPPLTLTLVIYVVMAGWRGRAGGGVGWAGREAGWWQQVGREAVRWSWEGRPDQKGWAGQWPGREGLGDYGGRVGGRVVAAGRVRDGWAGPGRSELGQVGLGPGGSRGVRDRAGRVWECSGPGREAVGNIGEYAKNDPFWSQQMTNSRVVNSNMDRFSTPTLSLFHLLTLKTI